MEEILEKTSVRRRFEGTVARVSGQKSISVLVVSSALHPKFRKHYKKTRKYMVHDEKGVAGLGDVVQFEECRPLSKMKRWTLVKVLSKGIS